MLLQQRSFLPAEDPLARFPCGSPLELVDKLGHDLPSLLQSPHCRRYLGSIVIPPPESQDSAPLSLPERRLYYLRLGFLASAYINQVGQPVASLLPKNIARPLVTVCQLLGRPTILSYDGYALFNWKRFDKNQAITLGNIDTLQNFVHLYDEHWFILIHVEIEALARFREIHYDWAQQNINHWVDDPRGTGGTHYQQLLKQLIDETRAAQK